MKVNEFIEKMKASPVMKTSNASAIVEYVKKELEVKSYLPFEEKRNICEKVLNTCNTVDENSGLVKVDSVSRYLLFTISILIKYTNLEFSSGIDDTSNSLDEYDMLCENNVLNFILEAIGNEYTVCNDMLNMMMADVMTNKNTLENVVAHSFNRFLNSIDKIINVVADKVDSLELDLDQIDIDKYKGLIDLFS